ncbi:MAG: RrF2 family transcriptional regulator [Acidimicrobiales bacterium]
MNMTLSKRGDYVVRSALSLARAYASGGHRKIREVVAEMDVPQTFASQILADLVRAGIATSRAGKDGGYRLVRSPASVSLLEVVEAGEGPLRSERCALGEGPCRWETVCPLHETWSAATSALRETLAKTSLATLVARDQALESSTYPLPPDSHRHGASTIAIEDWVQVELPEQAVRRHLVRADSWLPACIKSGYQDAEGLRQGVDPTSLPWSTSTAPMVAVLPCAPGTEEGCRITWEAGGSRGPSSRFEGTLLLHPVDDERTELRLDGKFRPPAPIAAADAALSERLSRATLRTALREMARVLEQPSGSDPRRRAAAR